MLAWLAGLGMVSSLDNMRRQAQSRILRLDVAFDFFTVSMTTTEIAKEFGEEPSAVTWGITITLMLRSVGALISGSICDKSVHTSRSVHSIRAILTLE